MDESHQAVNGMGLPRSTCDTLPVEPSNGVSTTMRALITVPGVWCNGESKSTNVTKGSL